MKPAHPIRLLPIAVTLALTAAVLGVTSCASNDELQDRLDDRNDSYSSLQERRKIRLDARQERTDAWFDRVMH